MTNLKTETLEKLTQNDKSIKDIRWIGNYAGTFRIDVDYFFKIADKEYDSGFGSHNINMGLVIVGDDWWMERGEYDGSEWWEFRTIPLLQKENKFSKSLFVKDYEDTWEEMSNLEYLEYKDEQKMGTNP